MLNQRMDSVAHRTVGRYGIPDLVIMSTRGRSNACWVGSGWSAKQLSWQDDDLHAYGWLLRQRKALLRIYDAEFAATIRLTLTIFLTAINTDDLRDVHCGSEWRIFARLAGTADRSAIIVQLTYIMISLDYTKLYSEWIHFLILQQRRSQCAHFNAIWHTRYAHEMYWDQKTARRHCTYMWYFSISSILHCGCCMFCKMLVMNRLLSFRDVRQTRFIVHSVCVCALYAL